MAIKKQPPGAEPETVAHTTLTLVQHDGDDYPAGMPIWLTPEQAKPLLDVKAIEPAAK